MRWTMVWKKLSWNVINEVDNVAREELRSSYYGMMCCKPITEQFVIFARGKCHEFPPLEGVESQDKSVHVFLISNSGFFSASGC